MIAEINVTPICLNDARVKRAELTELVQGPIKYIFTCVIHSLREKHHHYGKHVLCISDAPSVNDPVI